MARPATDRSAYVYRMGEYDVTVAQYVPVPQRRGEKRDTYGLYNSCGRGRAGFPTVGITQGGSSGDYGYSVTGRDPPSRQLSDLQVTWGDAARFCNWLQNGQPTRNSVKSPARRRPGRIRLTALSLIGLDGGNPQYRGNLFHPDGKRMV